MMIRRATKILMVFLVTGLIWEFGCRLLAVPSFILPPPSEIALSLVQRPFLFLEHAGVTLWETVMGFAIAVVFGVLVAGTIVVVPSLRDILMPLLLVGQIVPKVAVAPILLIWFGYGLAPKIIIAFLVSFFPIVLNVAVGLESAQRELIDLGRSLRATRLQIFRTIQMPAALPYLFAGMKIAITLAVIGAIIGEFVGGNRGLGYLIIMANQQLDTALAFAALTVISVAGLLLYWVIEALERLALPWVRSRQGVNPL